MAPKLLTALIAYGYLCQCHPQPDVQHTEPSAISVPKKALTGAGVPLDGFVSYSIEFSSFPDFAGNLSSPNTFSNNLLENLEKFSGQRPYIRVGGNTQDFAIFNKSQKVAEIGIFHPEISEDYPTEITIGPAFFESYHTWPRTKFVHGFNLGRNSSVARKALIDSVPYACKALRGRLLHWELGNEPDLYKATSVRPSTWNDQSYVNEWHKYTRKIRAAMNAACPDMATSLKYKYYAPSFAGTSATGGFGLDPLRTWQAGLDADHDIALISSHNYISGAESPGVTLQGTLMNHSSTVASVALQLNSSRHLASLSNNLNPNLPFILGETNSLYRQGRPGLSNTFGAALWLVDFNLYCASKNIRRTHMHMGTNYRYAAWQPIDTDKATKGTKAPYYGSIAVAAFLGDIANNPPSVVGLPLPKEEEAAYASYVGGELTKMMIINMQAYNKTDYNYEFINNYTRPVEQYTFQLPGGFKGNKVGLQRLLANGSDAITGVTFDGYSYNYELDEGRPVALGNVTSGESVEVDGKGRVKIGVPRSSAVILSFDGKHY